MDRLSLHIEYLLLRHDCVVVPGFGAFINVSHSAISDNEKCVISPMTREVRFNSALSHDDGMLANSYMRRERVPYATAREMVRTAVDQMASTLRNEGHVTVGRLGNIVADNEGRLSFHPLLTPQAMAERIGFVPATYGVAAVNTPTVNTDNIEEMKSAQAENVSDGRKFDTSKYYYIRINRKAARYVAMFAIVMLLAVSMVLPFTNNLHVDQASVVPVKAITETIASVRPDTPGISERKMPVAAKAEAKPRTVTKAEDMLWHLIVATFRTVHEAENYIAANNGNGYELTVVSSKSMSRVSARSAASKDDLLSELNSPQFQSRFPQAWIYSSK